MNSTNSFTSGSVSSWANFEVVGLASLNFSSAYKMPCLSAYILENSAVSLPTIISGNAASNIYSAAKTYRYDLYFVNSPSFSTTPPLSLWYYYNSSGVIFSSLSISLIASSSSLRLTRLLFNTVISGFSVFVSSEITDSIIPILLNFSGATESVIGVDCDLLA